MKNSIPVLLFLVLIADSVAGQKKMGTYNNLSQQILKSADASDIICIGEQSHGDTNALNLKTDILKELLGGVGVGALLFEAPLTASVISYFKQESYSEFVWPFWRYRSLKITLDSVIGRNNLITLGFDPQETCNYQEFTAFLRAEAGFLNNDRELAEMDSILAFAISDGSFEKKRALTDAEVRKVNEIVEKLKLNLHWPSGISKMKKGLILLCLENRKYLAQEMALQKPDEKVNFRDSIMALNLAGLLRILKPEINDQKVLIWAANLHIARNRSGGDFMMERFIAYNPEKVLSIGVIPRKSRRKAKRFDYTIVAGTPEYMSAEMLNDYQCE